MINRIWAGSIWLNLYNGTVLQSRQYDARALPGAGQMNRRHNAVMMLSYQHILAFPGVQNHRIRRRRMNKRLLVFALCMVFILGIGAGAAGAAMKDPAAIEYEVKIKLNRKILFN